MALGKAKKGADAAKKPDAKPAKLPDNAPLLVDRLKPLQMQKLLLDKMADGTPVTIDDVLHLLQKAETNKDIAAGKVADESEAESTHKSAALERMSSTTKIELEADFAQFDKNGTYMGVMCTRGLPASPPLVDGCAHSVDGRESVRVDSCIHPAHSRLASRNACAATG